MSPRAVLIGLSIGLASCASFQRPEPFDEAVLRERALTAERDGFRSAATLLTEAEIDAIFGLDLLGMGVEPAWLEIENHSPHPVFLMLSAIDPEYYAPLEVAHAQHRKFSREGNLELDRFLSELAFPNRPLIQPGSTTSGFVFLSESAPTKVIDIDLLGEELMVNMTLFVPNPRVHTAAERLATVQSRFSEPELIPIEDEQELRAALEGLPCCAQDAEGTHVAPLNFAVVGGFDHWVSAAVRTGYSYEEGPPLYAFQRPQDVRTVKSAKWVAALPIKIRFWQTPLRYRSAPVWLAQASTPRGGRFARDPNLLDRATDPAREDALMDLFYCQNLTDVGFALGAGCRASESAGVRTDGLRAVLIFEERAVSLSEIHFLDWERLIDHR